MARDYRMLARADSTSATRDAILDSTIALALERQAIDFTLDQVAERSGRTVQTVLRHFGSREALVGAAVDRASVQVAADRRPPDGDRDTALDLLVEHYEKWGRFVLKLLALDEESITGAGRLVHREWVGEVFGDETSRASDPVALVDMLVVVTDVYAWKLLRLDRGLPVEQVRHRIGAMCNALLGASR